MSDIEGATETSPLLKQGIAAGYQAQSGASVADALVPSQASQARAGTNAGISSPDQATSNPPGSEDAEASRPNPTPPDQERVQFQGIPEVRKQLKLIIPAVGIGVFLAAADLTLVASSAGKIGSDLDNLKNVPWIATGYFLTITAFQPLYGRLSDVFGRKTCILSAYLIFGFGVLWCGLATSMESLVAARAFTGIGGGGMTTCVSILLSDIVPLRERGTWQGLINIIFAIGSGIGGPLGGILSDTIGWHWAFASQFPMCILAFISVYFILKLPHKSEGHWREKLSSIDFSGALTLIVATAALLVGLDNGSNVSWQSAFTIVCLALSVPLMMLFIWIESRFASQPFAPSRIIFERSRFLAYMCNFFSFASWLGVMFYVPLYLQGAKDSTATQAGVALLPSVVANVSGSVLSGIIMQKSGKYYWLLAFSNILLVLGCILITLFTGTLTSSTLGVSIALTVGGLGHGSIVTVSLIALLSNSEVQDQAIVTACSYLFRSLGLALGLALQSALFQIMLRENLSERLGNDEVSKQIAAHVRDSLDYIRRLDPDLKTAVQEAYRESTTAVFALITGIAALSLFSSPFIREVGLGS